jgi:hypothetical protein
MQRTTYIILPIYFLFTYFPFTLAQCPFYSCHPAHDYRVWKVEDLQLRSSPSRSLLYASFNLYRARWHNIKYYTVPTPNICNDPSESEQNTKRVDWNVCSKVNLAPDGEELLPKELQRWLKWRATDLKERPLPQNASRRDFQSAKFEVFQGLPWPV